MSKQTKSQWDFGELFPAEQTRLRGEEAALASAKLRRSRLSPQARRVLSVSELTAAGQVAVGETGRLRLGHGRGHEFARAIFRPHLFHAQGRGVAVELRFVQPRKGFASRLLADGQKVLLQGDVTVYEARGQYQLIVRAVELQGVGALQIAFEKLKQKLAAEGLFAPERKRPLPKYPQRIGLVTSPTGAAIRDVLHVAQRRNPGLEIILAPCRVQGEGAAEEIAAAIRLLNEFSSVAADMSPLNG